MKSKIPAASRFALPRVIIVAAFGLSSAHAATFTPPAAGTGGTASWAAGTHWDTTPVSGIDSQLVFTGTLDAAAPVATSNDIASPFQLNSLSYNPTGPATGTAPTYTLSGSQLNFINSSGSLAPTLSINPLGVVKPGITINNTLLLSNDLTISGTNGVNLASVISGASSLNKTGPGTLTLGSDANSFGGVGKTITVSGSFISANGQNYGHLGNSNNKLVLNGGGYQYSPTNDPNGSFNYAIELQSGGTNTIRSFGSTIGRSMWLSSTLTGNGGFTNAGGSTAAYMIIGKNDGSSTLTGTVTSAASTIYVAADVIRDALGGANLNLNGGNFAFGGTSGTLDSPVSIANFSRNIAVNSANALSATNHYTFTHTGALTGASTLTLNNASSSGSKGIVGSVNASGANSVINLNGDLSGFSGGLSLTTGKLMIGSSATLPASFGVLTPANTAGVLVDLNGRSVTTRGLASGGTTGGNIQGNSTTTANTLTVNTTGTDRSYGGILSNGGIALNLTKTGTNTQTLTGANTYTGTTSINGGTLATTTGANTTARLQGGGSLALGGGTLSVTGSTTAATDVTQPFPGTTLNAGLSGVTSTSGIAGSQSNIALGQITRNAGSQVNLTLPATGSITTETANTATGILGGWATVGGNNWATSAGSPGTPGDITAYAGYTTQNDASLYGTAGNTGDITTSAAVTGTATTGTINSMRFNAAGAGQTLNIGSGDTLTVASGGILLTNTVSSAALISGGSLQGTSTTGLNIYSNTPNIQLTVSSVIKDNGGATALTVSSGNATSSFINLTGTTANTYTGQTYLNAGYLRLGNTTTGSNANLGDPATGATLNINGGTLFYDGNFALDNAGANKRDVVIGSKGATFRPVPTAATDSLTISGVISGSDFGALTLGGASNLTNGGGNLTLTGVNTYNGGTIISGAGVSSTNNTTAPTLILGNNSAIGTGTLTFAGAGGTTNVLGLRSLDATNLTLANRIGDISGTSVTLKFGSAGTGNLIFTNTASASLGAGATRTLQVDNAQTSLANGFSNTSAVIKTGTGILVFNGTHTYTGATTINVGTLKLIGSLAASAVTVNSTGTLAGTGSTGGNVTVNADGRLAFDVAAAPGSQDPLNITGILTINSGNFIDLTSAATPANGVYVLATANGGITYTPGTVSAGFGTVSVSGNNLILTVAGGGGGSSTYSSWASTNGVTGGVNGDSDNDGISNGVEYGLNTNPAASDGAPGTYSGNLLKFNKRVLTSGNADLLSYRIEISTDLGVSNPWVDVGSYFENNGSVISANIPTGPAKNFARLRVVVATP